VGLAGTTHQRPPLELWRSSIERQLLTLPHGSGRSKLKQKVAGFGELGPCGRAPINRETSSCFSRFWICS